MSDDDLQSVVQLVVAPQATQLLEEAKQLDHERSVREAILVDVGTLSGSQNEQLWQGAISLQKRIESGELSCEQVEAQFRYLPHSFVPTAEGAAERCGDGSSIEGYDDKDPRWFGRGLGPQFFGGTIGATYATRLFRGVSDSTHSFISDMKTFFGERKNHRFRAGDHTDDHATETNCGCGEFTGQPRKNDMLEDETFTPVVTETAAAILSFADITPAVAEYSHLQTSARALAVKRDYYPRADEVLAALRELNPAGIEMLIRPHNECSVTINFVKDTTFHRDHYNAMTDSTIQNFNVDAWYIVEQFGEVGYALVVDTILTAMNLTDGSLRLFVRLPREQEDALKAKGHTFLVPQVT